MMATGRSAALRRAGSFLSLLAFEVAAVGVLTRVGSVPELRIPWHNLTPWLLDSPVEDVLAAILRSIALLIAWWLLGSNLLYLLASLTRVPSAIRAVRWLTLPVVRRATDHALALTLATSLMSAGTGTAVAGAVPVVATAPQRPGAVAAQQQTSEPSSRQPGYVPRPAGKPPVAQPTPTSTSPGGQTSPTSTTARSPSTTTTPTSTTTTTAGSPSTTTTPTSGTSRPTSTASTTAQPRTTPRTSTTPPTTRPPSAGTTPSTTGYVPSPAGPPATTAPPRSTTPSTRPPATTTPPTTTGPPGGGNQQPAPSPQPPGGQQAGSHRVVRGDNLWTISRDHLAAATNRQLSDLSDHEIATYWLRVIAVNRSSLRSGNPDLIFPGELIMLPPVDGGS